MGPTPQVPQESISTSPKLCAVSSSQMHAYSKSGSNQPSPQETNLVNARLAEELRSVVIMNDKWQKYHKQQEKYINDLKIKLDQQKLKTEEAESRYSHVNITQRLQEHKIKEQEQTITCFRSLMEELDQTKMRNQRLEEELKVLKQTSEKAKTQDCKDESVQLLQYQLEVCIEDFKKEEKDKGALQNMCTSLQAKLQEANQLIADYREKVNIMKSIDFPSIHKGSNPDANYIQQLPVHRRRNRMSSSAPTQSSVSCRLDGINFPTTIEADSARHSPRGFELAPNFLSSETEEADEVEPLDESLEMVRH